MTENLAAPSGTFQLGGDLPVVRLGYGTMQLPGEGVWGPPKDHDEAIRVLRRAVEIGITFFDTADSYGPYVAEDLLREALHPYADDVVIATKAGLTRQGPGEWTPLGQPAYLRQEVELSLRRLGLERIDLFQLHRIDPAYPVADQVGELKQLQDEGKIRHIGLSEVERRRAQGGAEDRRDRLGAEPLQPRQPRRRGAARPLHAARTSASSRGSRWPPASCPSEDGPLAAAAKEHDATPVAARPRVAAQALARRCCRSPAPPASTTSTPTPPPPRIELTDEEFEALSKARLMRYERLGRSGLEVSAVTLGCMSWGDPDRGGHPWVKDEAFARETIRAALEAGINFFDTANVYSAGSSEEFTGRALREYAVARGRRPRHQGQRADASGSQRRRPVAQGDPARDRRVA